MIRTLPRVVPAEPGKPARTGAAASRRSARAIAEKPALWSADMAADVVRTYAELAPVWDAERGGYRPAPLADALDRGGPFPPGECVEVASGTGLLTALSAGRWRRVLCLDLSWDMLNRSRAPARVLADASRLPVADGRAAAVVLADAPLFAGEVVRVLAPAGVVVWSNALGPDAPNYVPVDVVHSALEGASDAPWSAVTADAGWGRWAVLRRD